MTCFMGMRAQSEKKMVIHIPDSSVVIKTKKAVSLPVKQTTPRLVPHSIMIDFFLTTTIIVKSTIGAGIIALPFTFSKLGYVFGPIVFMIFLVMNQFCTILLLKSKNLSRHSNFSTILYYIWHSDASRIFGSALIFIDNLGTCVSINMQVFLSLSSSKHPFARLPRKFQLIPIYLTAFGYLTSSS